MNTIRRIARGTGGRASVYVGLLLCAGGFVLIAVAWGAVADKTTVSEQLPYVVSAGFTGLGLIIIGALLISVVAQRVDASALSDQMNELIAAVRESRPTSPPAPPTNDAPRPASRPRSRT